MTSIDMNLGTQTFENSLPAAALTPSAMQQVVVDPIVIDDERTGDAEARESLLDGAFGPARFGKTCERLRAGRLPALGLSLVARVSRLGGGAVVGGNTLSSGILGTVRLWHVDAGGVPALMLGPLAVDARHRRHAIGARLMDEAIARARALGHEAILLVGDASYYARFGFERRHTLALVMPGPVEVERFLGLEIVPDAFINANGVVKATGAVDLSHRRLVRRPKLRRAA